MSKFSGLKEEAFNPNALRWQFGLDTGEEFTCSLSWAHSPVGGELLGSLRWPQQGETATALHHFLASHRLSWT